MITIFDFNGIMMIKLKFKIDIWHRSGFLSKPDIETINVEEDIDGSELFSHELERICRKHCDEYHYYVFMNGMDILWGTFFSKSSLDHLGPDPFYDESMLDVKAMEIIEDFQLTNKVIRLDINGKERGHEVGRTEGIKLSIYPGESNQHHNKHIHCSYQGEEIVIDIESIQVSEGRFRNRRKQTRALEIVKMNQSELLCFWEQVVCKGRSYKFEMHY